MIGIQEGIPIHEDVAEARGNPHEIEALANTGATAVQQTWRLLRTLCQSSIGCRHAVNRQICIGGMPRLPPAVRYSVAQRFD
jgi:hypothetical protein